jgi:hypothetical protein
LLQGMIDKKEKIEKQEQKQVSNITFSKPYKSVFQWSIGRELELSKKYLDILEFLKRKAILKRIHAL